MTLVLAWSEAEVARYLETMKAYEGKDATSIQKRKKTTVEEQVADVLGCVRSVNKTDAAQLMMQFETLGAVVRADVEKLGRCPGIGDKKVRRLWEAFHKPFSIASVAKARREQEEAEMVVLMGEKEGSGGDDDNDDDNDDYAVEVLAIHNVGDDTSLNTAKDDTGSSSTLAIGDIVEV